MLCLVTFCFPHSSDNSGRFHKKIARKIGPSSLSSLCPSVPFPWHRAPREFRHHWPRESDKTTIFRGKNTICHWKIYRETEKSGPVRVTSLAGGFRPELCSTRGASHFKVLEHRFCLLDSLMNSSGISMERGVVLKQLMQGSALPHVHNAGHPALYSLGHRGKTRGRDENMNVPNLLSTEEAQNLKCDSLTNEEINVAHQEWPIFLPSRQHFSHDIIRTSAGQSRNRRFCDRWLLRFVYPAKVVFVYTSL